MGIKKVVFCGGGSGGHVIPARTLINDLILDIEIEVSYIGSIKGIERKVMTDLGLPYKAIRTGKLRRYLSFQNFLDVFNILLGIFQSFITLLVNRPQLIILTGGFVIVPVAIAGYVLRIPMFLHEQTTRIGLANKLASYLVDRVMISFESSAQFLPDSKTSLTGYPLRDSIYQDVSDQVILEGENLKESKKPILFVTGGGNGSELLNKFIETHIKALSEKYLIIHQTGRDHVEKYKKYQSSDYIPLGFMGDEYLDILKLAKCIISRSGAGTVAELLGLGKKSIYIPLKIAQKNEQYHNAMEAHKLLQSIVIEEKDFENEAEVLKKIMNFEPFEKEISKLEDNPKSKIIRLIKENLNS